MMALPILYQQLRQLNPADGTRTVTAITVGIIRLLFPIGVAQGSRSLMLKGIVVSPFPRILSLGHPFDRGAFVDGQANAALLTSKIFQEINI